METEVMLLGSSSSSGLVESSSRCTSPYISAPSSPPRPFGGNGNGNDNFFFSAPTSPVHHRPYSDDDYDFNFDHTSSSCHYSPSAVPFHWEEKPGIPKSPTESPFLDDFLDKEDFAFDFSGQLDSTSLSAEELFDGGKIKPLKPPPARLHSAAADSLSPKSPRSPKQKIKDALSSSPRHNNKIKDDFDPFAAALEHTRKQSISSNIDDDNYSHRGRERTLKSSSSIRQKGGTRSLSPLRASDLLFDDEENNQQNAYNTNSASSSSSVSSSFSRFWYRKWKLKDLLLFRSASEGRATTSKDQLNSKYSMLKNEKQKKKDSDQEEDVIKNSSFRSMDSVASSSVSSSKRRGGQVSAHELHYTANRAVSEELKKKTFLPYKQGLLGCLGFNPGVPIHEISKGLGSMSRQNS